VWLEGEANLPCASQALVRPMADRPIVEKNISTCSKQARSQVKCLTRVNEYLNASLIISETGAYLLSLCGYIIYFPMNNTRIHEYCIHNY
jgi:hypothetical protein